jgi:hypothetical protein
MTSEARVRAWLNRVPPAAERIDLSLHQLGIDETVGSWAREELAAGDPASIVIDAAQAHCDALEASARYTVQWVSADGRTLSTLPMRLSPTDGAPRERFGGEVEDPTMAGAMGQLLRHQEVMARMYIGAQSGLLANMQQLLKLQSETIREQGGQIRTLTTRVRANERGADDADDVESVARAEAVTKVTDAVVHSLLPILAARLNGHAGHAADG